MSVNQAEPIGFTLSGVLALAGGGSEVARRLGLRQQSVAKWSGHVPEKHARQVAIMAGLPLEIVRPDMVRNGHAQAQ